jgi:hypothetical protein
MTFRKATAKERAKYGVVNRITGRRKKPLIGSSPPPAPWSAEAIEAADASALARKLPPMIAMNLHRIDNGGYLLGVFDLYLPALHLTFHGCKWFSNRVNSAWVRLPNRYWIDQNDQKHYEPTVTIDDVYAERFEQSAMTALGELLKRAESEPADERRSASVTPLRIVEGDPGEDVPF